jgi:hypothetical protein
MRAGQIDLREARMQSWLDHGAQLAWPIDPIDANVSPSTVRAKRRRRSIVPGVWSQPNPSPASSCAVAATLTDALSALRYP